MAEGANQVFGEPPVKQTTGPGFGDSGEEQNAGHSGAERGARGRPAEIPGGLFKGAAERTNDDA